jgi:gamma-glutamyltranspeptidase / glutathione hydrolase / leukotriene-C4 hydrolase
VISILYQSNCKSLHINYEYFSQWRDSLRVDFRKDYELVLTPPPFGGAVMGMALNLLEGFDLLANDSLTEHYLVESWKWAFGDRYSLGDPGFNPGMEELVRTMLSKSHADEIRTQFSSEQTFPVEYYSDLVNISSLLQPKEDHGTMHFSVIDKTGNVVALTSTVNLVFGSLVVGKKTGIVFNDQMDDFSTGNTNAFGVESAEPNKIEPGKRPLSSMCPTIILNKQSNKVVWTGGASGGTRIITATMQVLLNSLLFGYDVSTAVSLPRIHEQLLPDYLYYEPTFSTNQLDDLRDKGHNVSIFGSVFS